MKHICLAMLTVLLWVSSAYAAEEEKHLFILSGQSNMPHMNPAPFNQAVKEAFGNNNVFVVKVDSSGQPISRWYKKWESAEGEKPNPERTGDLYDVLMKKTKALLKKHKMKTVTFIWMQGETDARKDGEVYEASLLGLLDQLKTDLGRKDLNFVIGRISDHNLVEPEKWQHWDLIREIQVKVAEADPRGAWVDTDDLNDGKTKKGKTIKNGVHYTKEGYAKLAERFAQKAIALIKDPEKKTKKPPTEKKSEDEKKPEAKKDA